MSRFAKLIYYSIHRTCAQKGYKPTAMEIEDLFNDVLVNFIKDDYKKLRQYRGDDGATIATWIRTVTVRFIIDYLRIKARNVEHLDISSEIMQFLVSVENPVKRPDEVYEENEQDRQLEQAIGILPEKDQYFMELYYAKGLSPDQVGQTLGISVKTVYSRINRIKEKLKEEIVD